MGWCSFNMRGNVKDWFKSNWDTSSDYEVLDVALVQRNTLYSAIKKKSTNEVFCAVYLIRWARGYYNFSYKDMTEHSGPNVVDCPERIFKLLTPLDDTNDPNGWARGWREKVQKYYDKRNQLKGNTRFKTNEPVHFTNGSSYEYFEKIGRHISAGIMIGDEFRYCSTVRFNPLNYDIEKISSACVQAN
jgi:hypothetical protein